MPPQLTETQSDLAGEMHQISERGYCAGWMSGLEFRLWDVLINGPCEFGAIDITQENIDTLRRLSEECQGWIAWDETILDRSFVPLSDWHKRFAVWKAKQLP